MTLPSPPAPLQERERRGVTRRLHLEGPDGPLTCYATLNLGPDGAPCELLIRANKQGTLEHGLLHCLGLMVTTALGSGVSLATIAAALKGVEFEPQGVTGSPEIPMVRSVVDYLARWLETKETKNETQSTLDGAVPEDA